MSDASDATTAERALLGSILTGAPIDDVAGELDGGDFYQPRHGTIWEACVDVARQGRRPDLPTVTGVIGKQVDPMYLAELTSVDSAPTPAQASYYAEIVSRESLRRRLIAATIRIRQETEGADDVRSAAENARREIDEAASRGVDEDAGVSVGRLLDDTLDALEKEPEGGLDTGWLDLDHDVNGLRPGQLVIVGARPSVGKSVIAGNLAAHVCGQGVGVHFASLEMTRREVMNRMLSSVANVDLAKLMAHKLSEDDWSRVNRRYPTVREWPLWVDDTAQQSLLQIRARARTTKKRIGLGLLIVDYLQLMAPRDRRVPREQQVGELSEGLKNLAKELECPVVALAQLNRGSAERQDKRPILSDLRESGRIEADADHAWLLHRQDVVDPESTTGELEVIVAKNRNGPSGKTVKLAFQGRYARAVSAAHEWTPTKAIGA